MDLNIIWFLLIAFLFAGYAILDGFDLGVGFLHLFTRDEREKQANLNAIGPFWDGNEVWLLTAGGALFAAFPKVYATVFSAFYLALVLLLVGLIFRAVALEFRHQVESPGWTKFWDLSFGLGSSVTVLLLGVAFGNILRGIPLNSSGTFTGNFFGLLNPYSLLVGVFVLVSCIMHSAIFICMKTEAAHQARIKNWASKSWMLVVVLYLAVTTATFFSAPNLFKGVVGTPVKIVFLIILLASLAYIPAAVNTNKFFKAFLASSALFFSLISLGAAGLFPRLVPSSLDLAYSLTIYNASSTAISLKTMLVIALLGMPFVLGYTWYIYKIFSGKVKLDGHGY